MPVHALEIDDFYDDNYTLIGIHTTLEMFQLAYSLNTFLTTKFARNNQDLDFKNNTVNASFALYRYENTKLNHNWFLIENQFIDSSQSKKVGFFTTNETRTYLIPEKKKVDFFLKLEGSYESLYIKKTIDAINKIHQVITSYTIEPNTLKSKDFLIF